MQKLSLVQPCQLTWHSLFLSVFSLGEVRGKNKNHFYQYLLFQICPKNSPVSNMWHHCTSPVAIFAPHFLLAIPPLLLPGVGQHCGQHMQLTICSIRTLSTHFTQRSPSRNLKSFSICDETGNEQGFQYQRQTIISADHYILAWKKLLNWEFCLQRSCTNAVAGGTRGLIFANVDRSQW